MLIALKSEKISVSPTQNLKFDCKAALLVVDFHQRMLFQWKNFFFVVDQHWCTAAFFSKLAGPNYKNYYYHASQTNWKVKWVIYWNNFFTIATHSEGHLWSMAKTTHKLY